MSLRNRRETAVDPVPFLVVATAAIALCFIVGPPYLLALGADVTLAAAATSAVALVAVGTSYHRLVWAARPELRDERPTSLRLQTLGYATLTCLVVGILLVLPFV